jgi:hypothetical protein
MRVPHHKISRRFAINRRVTLLQQYASASALVGVDHHEQLAVVSAINNVGRVDKLRNPEIVQPRKVASAVGKLPQQLAAGVQCLWCLATMGLEALCARPALWLGSSAVKRGSADCTLRDRGCKIIIIQLEHLRQ